jgi:hypothetical protein
MMWALCMIRNILNKLRFPSDQLLKAKVSKRPIIDRYSVTADLDIVFKRWMQNNVPLLLGWNADERNFIGQILIQKHLFNKSKRFTDP